MLVTPTAKIAKSDLTCIRVSAMRMMNWHTVAHIAQSAGMQQSSDAVPTYLTLMGFETICCTLL